MQDLLWHLTSAYLKCVYGRAYATSWPNFLGWIVYQIFLPMVLRCARASRAGAPLWFYQMLLKWYCNSLLLLSRLTTVTKKTAKTVHLNLKLNQLPRLSVSSQWLVTRVAWATGLLNSWKQFHVLIESTTKNWIRLPVLSCCLKITSPLISRLPATEFWLICSVYKNFILMWVYHLWQNEWLFW